MTPTYDQVGDWMEEVAGRFPDVFFETLNGGIHLNREEMPDSRFPPGEMYIMGQYLHDALGKYIVIYYGSILQLYPHASEKAWKDELFRIIAHEFTHHFEETANLHALDDKDKKFLEEAQASLGLQQ